MKAAVFALLLLLSLNQGEALRCNICFGRGPKLCNAVDSLVCPSEFDACAAVTVRGFDLRRSFRSCLNLSTCQRLNMDKGTRATCCTTDLCN